MSSLWSRLSERERRLALATLGLLVAAMAILAVTRAIGHLRDQDRAIARLEQDLENSKGLEARGVSVDRAYAAVAAQHSSAWNEAEIANRLRMEIYRLAMADPNAAIGTGQKLVDIPALREGSLKAGASEDYREYQLSITIPTAPLANLIEFVARLQQSPQALRIDGLDLSRWIDSNGMVGAVIDVTRMIVAGAPASDLPENPNNTPGAASAAVPSTPEPLPPVAAPASWSGESLDAWRADGTKISMSERMPADAPGGQCLRAEAQRANARVFMPQTLVPGRKYQLSLDIAATGKTDLELLPDRGTGAETQSVELKADGAVNHYEIEFEAPSSQDDLMRFRAPSLRLLEAGASVYVDNVNLQPLSE